MSLRKSGRPELREVSEERLLGSEVPEGFGRRHPWNSNQGLKM